MAATKNNQLLLTIKAHILRIIYILFIISFFMPYATVTGCTSKKVTDFTGIDMIMHDEGLIYIVPIIIFIIFLITSFIKQKTNLSMTLLAFIHNWKAIMTSLAGIIIGIFPQLQFLFDEFEPRVGLIISILCCFAVFCYNMAETITHVKIIKNESGLKLFGSNNYSRFWYVINWIIIVCSILVVPYFFIENIHDIYIAFILLFFMTIPFILSQIIVLAALIKNQPWSIRWSRAFSIIFVLFIAFMLYMYHS